MKTRTNDESMECTTFDCSGRTVWTYTDITGLLIEDADPPRVHGVYVYESDDVALTPEEWLELLAVLQDKLDRQRRSLLEIIARSK